MASKQAIRDRAASDLGRLRLGQQLQYQDQVRIESAYDEVYEDLKDEGLAIWASTADAPTRLVPHLVALVAENCLDTYGVPNDRYQRIKLAAQQAKPEIRRLVIPRHESLEAPTDY